MAEILTTRTSGEWLSFCRVHGIPATRSAGLDDLVRELPLAEHPHAGAYQQIPPPVRFGSTPTSIDRHAPLVGEHGRDVLAEVGYADDELDELERTGVLFDAPHGDSADGDDGGDDGGGGAGR